jgi:hypothetical protein
MPPKADRTVGKEDNPVVHFLGEHIVIEGALAIIIAVIASWTWPELAWFALAPLAWILINPAQKRLRPKIQRWWTQRKHAGDATDGEPVNRGLSITAAPDHDDSDEPSDDRDEAYSA